MPIKKYVEVSTDISWAIWEITEEEEELRDRLELNNHDRTHLSSIRHPKKTKEYLAGRMVLRHLFRSLKLGFPGIYKDQWGKPHLLNHTFQISISNTYPYAIAMINQSNPAGIDMEKTDPKFLRIKHKYLNRQELEMAGDDLRLLNIMWCAKEALYKVFGKKRLSFRENITIKPFWAQSKGQLSGAISIGGNMEEIKLEYLNWGNYVICYRI